MVPDADAEQPLARRGGKKAQAQRLERKQQQRAEQPFKKGRPRALVRRIEAQYKCAEGERGGAVQPRVDEAREVAPPGAGLGITVRPARGGAAMGIFDAGVEIQPPRLLLRLAGARGGLPAREREIVPGAIPAARLFPLRAGQGLLRGGGGQGHVHHVRPARAGVYQRAALGLGPRHLPAHGAQAHELRAQGVGERQRAGLHLFYLLQREPQRAQALDLHQRVQVVLRVVAVAVGGARGAQQPLGFVKAYPGARQAAALLHLLDVHVTASHPYSKL